MLQPTPLRSGAKRLLSSGGSPALARVNLQLDYFLSTQFAGVAVAMQQQLYERVGIDLKLMETCPPGDETSRVLSAAQSEQGVLSLGVTEQYVLSPLIASRGHEVRGIGAMFGQTPLAVACLPERASSISNPEGLKVGTHDDTVDLVRRILPGADVKAVPREVKLDMLLSGELDAVQIYDVMESVKLRGALGENPFVAELEGLNGASLGYAQCLFAPKESLADPELASHARKFMAATEAGWIAALRDPRAAAEIVLAQQPSGKEIGHWEDTLEFTEETLRRCNDYVKAGRRGGALLTVDPARWMEADAWILGENRGAETVDASIWCLDSKIMPGHDLARPMLADVKRRADALPRRPSLCIFSVGNPKGAKAAPSDDPEAARRMELFSPPTHSWFSRVSTGRAAGVDVETVTLPEDATQEELEAVLRSASAFDAVQINQPLPAHIDTRAAAAVLRPGQDVDAWDYLHPEGSVAFTSSPSFSRPPRMLPVTAAATLALMDHHGVGDVAGKRVVVVGRGPLVGAPIAHSLTERGATVSVAHSRTPRKVLQELCESADVLVPCVGMPGVIDGAWIKEGAVVVNVGTSFDADNDALLGDVSGVDANISADGAPASGVLAKASKVAACPGGVGPVVVAQLFDAVVARSERVQEREARGATASTPVLPENEVLERMAELNAGIEASSVRWTLTSAEQDESIPALTRSLHFGSYSQAARFLSRLVAKADEMDHHPNARITHHCRSGVDLQLELFTLAVGGLTDFDFDVARVVNELYGSGGGDVHAGGGSGGGGGGGGRGLSKGPTSVSRAPSPSSSSFSPPQVKMEDFVYHLPDELIATSPPSPRGSSRLLVTVPSSSSSSSSSSSLSSSLSLSPLQQHLRSQLLLSGGVSPSNGEEENEQEHADMRFRDLPRLLPEDAHLVFNESKVVPARCFADGGVEVMFLAPEASSGEFPAVLSTEAEGQEWRCMIRQGFCAPGKRLVLDAGAGLACEVTALHSAWVEEGEEDGVEATVRLVGSGTAADFFDAAGHIPLPPYMRREATVADSSDYQTVYASEERGGSVAAPTAGLHFTEEVLAELRSKGMKTTNVCLHVGAGTFKPVSAETAAEHEMHEEKFSVPRKAVRDLLVSLRLGRPIVPVGTTSVRVLESLYWLGVERSGTSVVDQWTPYRYEGQELPSPRDALEALLAADGSGGDEDIAGTTRLLIAPGYTFRLCDALVTNFHQPHSTLVLLVAALLGGDAAKTRRLYDHGVAKEYKFLSYGDACLIHNQQQEQGEQQGREVEGKNEAQMAATAPNTLPAGSKVLLHSCCAPCSGAMIEQMRNEGHDVTIFFYNPNIHPKQEYEIRKEENKQYAAKLGIPFVDLDYDEDLPEWHRRAKGLEFSPERGERCTKCFDMRFEKTAAYAEQHGFSYITTTNATSRWKDADQVNASGIRAAQAYAGVSWWSRDWQTEEMTERKYRINAEQEFYKQEYCGCSHSLRDTNAYRKDQGMEAIRPGQGETYSDPKKDSEEESLEVVAEFFGKAGAQAEQREQRRKMYQGRKREGKENW